MSHTGSGADDGSSKTSMVAEGSDRTELNNLKQSIEAFRETKRNGGMETVTPSTDPDLSRMKACRLLHGHFGKIYAMHWAGSACNEELVSASQDGKLIIWNANTTFKRMAIPLRSSWVMTCAFERRDSHYIACGGLDNVCSVYRTDIDTAIATRGLVELDGHEGYVSCCRFIDENSIITSSGDTNCIYWDVEKCSPVSTFKDHTGDVMSLSVNPVNDKLFISGCCDTTCKSWDIRVKDCVATYSGHEADINSVMYFPDGMAFASGSDDSTCRLFDMRCHQEVNSFSNDRILCGVTSIDFSKSGRLLFAGYDDYTTHAWDVLKPAPSNCVFTSNKNSGHENRVSCLGVSSNGDALCTGSWDTTLKILA